MKKVSTYVLRDRLSAYLDEVIDDGTSIIIHRYGKPVAKLIPYEDKDRKKLLEEINSYYGMLGEGGEDGVAFVNRVRRNKRERDYVKKLREGRGK